MGNVTLEGRPRICVDVTSEQKLALNDLLPQQYLTLILRSLIDDLIHMLQNEDKKVEIITLLVVKEIRAWDVLNYKEE